MHKIFAHGATGFNCLIHVSCFPMKSCGYNNGFNLLVHPRALRYSSILRPRFSCIQLLLPPEASVVGHRVHYLCDASSIQINELATVAVQREHWQRHIPTRRSIDREARNILLESKGNRVVLHAGTRSIEERVRDVLPVQAGRNGELIGICVIAKCAIEVVGVASRLGQSRTQRLGWPMENLRER